jgi:hypothetical protein
MASARQGAISLTISAQIDARRHPLRRGRGEFSWRQENSPGVHPQTTPEIDIAGGAGPPSLASAEQRMRIACT